MGRVALLLDDDAVFRELVASALSAEGYRVHEAPQGRQAMRLLQEHDFDILIVDGLLPDTSGPKWIEAVRQQGVDLPIVFVSAFFRDLGSFKMLTEELRVQAVINKPVEPQQFVSRCNAILATRDSTGIRKRDSRTTIDAATDIDAIELDAPLAPVERDVVAGGREVITTGKWMKESYEDVLPHILELFVRAIRRALKSPEARGHQEDAILQAHNLSGTAASYGFPEIGKNARIIESELRNRSLGRPADEAAIRTALDRVENHQLATGGELAQTLGQGRQAAPAPPPIPAEILRRGRSRDWARTLGDPRPTDRRAAVTEDLNDELVTLISPSVLVLHSDDATSQYTARSLANLGVDVRECRDPSKLDSLLPVDLAIVSAPYGAPGIAERLTAKIRAARRQTKVAFVGPTASRDLALMTKVDAYLEEPFTPQSLLRALRRMEGDSHGDLRVHVHNAPQVTASLKERGLNVYESQNESALFSVLERVRPHVLVLSGVSAARLAQLVRLEHGFGISILAAAAPPAVMSLGVDAVLGETAAWADVVLDHGRRAASSLRSERSRELPDRWSLARHLHGMIASGRRRSRPVAVAAIALQGAKQIEDKGGAALLEQVVQVAADIVRARFRVEDIAGRWTRDILIAGFSEQSAEGIASAVRRAQEEISSLAFSRAGERLEVSFRGAIASVPDDAEQLSEVLRVLERRLRIAKKMKDGSLLWTG